MNISFHGATRTFTGSKHLITLNDGRKLLLDCGMFQGLGRETDVLNRDFNNLAGGTVNGKYLVSAFNDDDVAPFRGRLLSYRR